VLFTENLLLLSKLIRMGMGSNSGRVIAFRIVVSSSHHPQINTKLGHAEFFLLV
jgi:hypothetical protein